MPVAGEGAEDDEDIPPAEQEMFEEALLELGDGTWLPSCARATGATAS